LTKNVGIELPEFLGKLSENPDEAAGLIKQAKLATPPAATQEDGGNADIVPEA
jgi:hypothetical protein